MSGSRLFALAVVVAVTGVAVVVFAFALHPHEVVIATTVIETAATSPADASSLRSAAMGAAAGVVSILATTTLESSPPFGPPVSQEAVVSGSGFVLDKQGHLLTSQHVVAGATRIHVTFADGHKVHAKVVASAQIADSGGSYCIGGDIITAIAGHGVTDGADLETALAAQQPGDKVKLTVVHANRTRAHLAIALRTEPFSAPETTTGCQ